jgi:hypothetical protein
MMVDVCRCEVLEEVVLGHYRQTVALRLTLPVQSQAYRSCVLFAGFSGPQKKLKRKLFSQAFKLLLTQVLTEDMSAACVNGVALSLEHKSVTTDKQETRQACEFEECLEQAPGTPNLVKRNDEEIHFLFSLPVWADGYRFDHDRISSYRRIRDVLHDLVVIRANVNHQ